MNTVESLQMVDIDLLVPYINNARVHGPSQIECLRASMREFGFVAPVLMDGAFNIIAGHGRIVAAKAEGFKQVPCVLVDYLTEEQRRAYILADNRLAELATWDNELVATELTFLHDAGFDFSITGFDDSDLELVNDNEISEDDAFDIKLPAKPKSARGAIYALGRHRLMCGDATLEPDMQALLGGATADLLLTDPPYNVNITGQTEAALTILNDNFSDDDKFKDFLVSAFSAAKEHIAPGGGFYIWHPDGAQGWAFRQACRETGLCVRQCLVWEKQSATMGRQDYHWQHEPCLHGEIDLPREDWNDDLLAEHEACLYGWKDGKAHLWCADRKQTTVLHFDRPSRSSLHPTMKPVKLIAYQICNSTLRGATVLDMFAGSGTTVIAAEQTGRTAYAMELDPLYVDVIIERWEALTGQKAEVIK